MPKQALMTEIEDVRKRARTSFDRNWRSWARDWFAGVSNEPALQVSLHPPREVDLGEPGQLARARSWVARWRDCVLPGVEWQRRAWARVGDQSIPVRVSLVGAASIAAWAGREELWQLALTRMEDVRHRFFGNEPTGPAREEAHPEEASRDLNAMPQATGGRQFAGTQEAHEVPQAIHASIADWCALADDDWATSLDVWDWLFAHPHEAPFVRQLPIRGIDTKWIERHGKALRELHRAIAGHDFSFEKPAKLFRCRACSQDTQLGSCDEFALSAAQLATLSTPPETLVICENLVNTLCLHDLPHALAVHGSGFAIAALQNVPWLAETRLLYWGDLDSNGFAILNQLRAFAPHAQSIMMDTRTLHLYFDLCVDEPKPVTGELPLLTQSEREALHALAQGDPARGIAHLRLEQERIEWNWAYNAIAEAVRETGTAEP